MVINATELKVKKVLACKTISGSDLFYEITLDDGIKFVIHPAYVSYQKENPDDDRDVIEAEIEGRLPEPTKEEIDRSLESYRRSTGYYDKKSWWNTIKGIIHVTHR